MYAEHCGCMCKIALRGRWLTSCEVITKREGLLLIFYIDANLSYNCVGGGSGMAGMSAVKYDYVWIMCCTSKQIFK